MDGGRIAYCTLIHGAQYGWEGELIDVEVMAHGDLAGHMDGWTRESLSSRC